MNSPCTAEWIESHRKRHIIYGSQSSFNQASEKIQTQAILVWQSWQVSWWPAAKGAVKKCIWLNSTHSPWVCALGVPKPVMLVHSRSIFLANSNRHIAGQVHVGVWITTHSVSGYPGLSGFFTERRVPFILYWFGCPDSALEEVIYIEPLHLN